MSTNGLSRGWAATVVVGMALAAGLVAQGSAHADSQALPSAKAAQAHYTPTSCNTPQPATHGVPRARCFSTVWTPNNEHRIEPDASGPPAAARTPADIQDAYDLPVDQGAGQTVAIVDAFGDSHAEADLAAFRSQFGLPPCTTDNGCLRIVDQRGGSDLPPDGGWTTEISLDLDAASSVCPKCNLLLVLGDSNSLGDLGTGVDTAVSLGAVAVSNSYGAAGEGPQQLQYDHFYMHTGVAITASSGDGGYGIHWPASNPTLTSVGGTRLSPDDSNPRGWTETVWGSAGGGNGAGSGCSAYEEKPDFQNGYGTQCDMRADADVSADADPATGLAVYDSAKGGWLQVGGTSLSSPLVAATYALAGAPNADDYPVSYAYHDPNRSDHLFDVTEGANGGCAPAVWCTAGAGWDGPTGLGTPNGVAAFTGGPHGSITGQVTEADTSDPIGGATVTASPGHYVTTTDVNGSYTLSGVRVGDVQVTVSDVYAYQDQSASVTLTDGQTTTQVFALTPIPTNTVSGTVTAGGGQPWPLYAKVVADDGAGHTVPAFTNPATGAYALQLLPDVDYTLHVTAQYPGYQPADKTVSLGDSDVTADVTLDVDALACTAIGYHPAYSGGSRESFDRPRLPRGWQVTNTNRHYRAYQYRPGWEFGDPGNRGNHTGGSGDFAVVDSDHDGQHHYQDTVLTSPAVDLSAATTPAVEFATDYEPAVNSTATVGVSTDGGTTWTTAWTRDGFAGGPGPETVVAPLPQAAGHSAVRVRFGYTGQWSKYWELDDVFVGDRTCTQQSGGLLVGQVNDDAGTGIAGATVSSVTDADETTTTVATPDDPNVGDGFYTLFTTATGSQQFTAARDGYASDTETATVTTGLASTLDFTLTTAG